MMTRYLAGLSVAGVGLCAGGWLIVTATAFGPDGGEAGRLNLAAGAGLALVGAVTAVAWAVAWRQRLRADGVLTAPGPPAPRISPVSRREARRNRRQLARDVRHAARLSKRMARDNRRGAALERPWNGEHLGDGWHPAFGPPARRPRGPADGVASYAGTGPGAAGHDGASAADLLGELRTLLGPLLAAAASSPPPAPPAPGPAGPGTGAAPPVTLPAQSPWPQSRRGGPWPAGPWRGDGEEAWW
jgi:hypothetical protein